MGCLPGTPYFAVTPNDAIFALVWRLFRSSTGAKRAILWVVRDNADAIAKYRHYGFREDTLVDRIMIRRR